MELHLASQIIGFKLNPILGERFPAIGTKQDV